MFSLNVVLHMGNIPRVVLTFFALPAAIVILEHEIFHKYVQILDSVSGDFQKDLLINFVHTLHHASCTDGT